MFPAQWVRDIVEGHTDSRHPVIGETWIYDDKEVTIIGGSYWGAHGLSNFWYFKFPDGTRGGTYNNDKKTFYPKGLAQP